MRFLLFSTSLRKDSLNTRLIKLAANIIEKHNGDVDLAGLSEFDCPSFNQDLEANSEIPAEAITYSLEDSLYADPSLF